MGTIRVKFDSRNYPWEEHLLTAGVYFSHSIRDQLVFVPSSKWWIFDRLALIPDGYDWSMIGQGEGPTEEIIDSLPNSLYTATVKLERRPQVQHPATIEGSALACILFILYFGFSIEDIQGVAHVSRLLKAMGAVFEILFLLHHGMMRNQPIFESRWGLFL